MRNFFNRNKKNNNTVDVKADTRSPNRKNLESPKFSQGDIVVLKEEVSVPGFTMPVDSPCTVISIFYYESANETRYLLCNELSEDEIEEYRKYQPPENDPNYLTDYAIMFEIAEHKLEG